MRPRTQWPQILLIRHGQTDANAAGVLQGHLETTLNDLGRQQALRIAGRLRGFMPPIERLISSDLGRALETARPIAETLGLPVERSVGWRERGFGALEGQPVGELEVWRAASGGELPPGGESLPDFERRVSKALRELAEESLGRSAVAVVTHGGPIRLLLNLMAAGRVPLAGGVALSPNAAIANASILHVAPEPEVTAGLVWRVLAANDVAHLADVVSAANRP